MDEPNPVRYEFVGYGAEIVPLYDRSDEVAYLRTQVQPLTDEVERLRLTDAEREAIGVAIQCVEAAMAQRHPEEEDARDLLWKTTFTLRRLLERMRKAT